MLSISHCISLVNNVHYQKQDMLIVDFEDLESTGAWTQSLRQYLIDRNNGKQHYSAVELLDEVYVINQQRTWYFRPIGKTPYS